MKVTIRRVSLVSLGKHGCLLGGVAALLPSLVCSLLGLSAASILHRWMGSWQDLTISVLGQEVAQIDLVALAGLEGLLGQLRVVTGVSAPLLFLAVLALTLAFGLLLALIAALVGLAYNLLAHVTGGLVVDMQAFGSGAEQPELPSDEHTA
jgi:hypothetical protein